MLLTKAEKKLLKKLVAKEKRRRWFRAGRNDQLSELEEKLDQSIRNERVNSTNPSKL
ncbi:hypothetical protein [Alkalicoccus urumqiensis]|uniref:hypothetical protein n=1 Tax=Alkalicoccus urumqiensis TaxID=1548213 RepID=UPI0015E5F5FD|nr:hypothetical protein [Alkalicoccus urumqiensis]